MPEILVIPQLGEVLPLVRSLANCPEPLALYASLSDNGRRPDTLLLETADMPEQGNAKSVLLAGCAVRVECRGRVVTAHALSDNGRDVLPFLADRLAGSAVIEQEQDRLTARFAPVLPGRSEAERLALPSPADVLRILAMGWKPSPEPAGPLLVAGVFAYDFLDAFEALPPAASDPLDYPDYVFWLPEAMIVLQHSQQQAQLVANVFGGPHALASCRAAEAALEQMETACRAAQETQANMVVPVAVANPRTNIDDAGFVTLVEELKQHIIAGDVFQIVASRTFQASCSDPLAAYAALRAINPSPYMFYVSRGADTLFGASPETCVKVSGSPLRVEIRPIAGTRPRGRAADGGLDADLDSRLETELRLNEKEVAEHMMLVDLARNDIARVSQPGTRRVERLLTVERYSHVMHLVSHVSGQLAPQYDALHAYVASMNMGTLVGAPKLKAAELLRQVEPTRRGPYGGAVGYLAADGQMDTAIVIRSALVRAGVASVQAGAGIVYDSDPQEETMETLRKASAVLQALQAGDRK